MGSPRALRSPLSLVVLGLLAEQSLHPYAMRGLMRERGHDRIVKRGAASLYDAVARLASAGLIEAQETSRAGRRPERTVYRITPQGLGSLQSWVRDALADAGRPEQFTAALSFMYVVPQREAIALLEQRVSALSALITTAEAAILAAADAGVPVIFLSEESYSQALRHAERDWLEQFIQQLRSGQLRWPESRHTEE
jgi:DNA-binding PadR family transcriptional regulator